MLTYGCTKRAPAAVFKPHFVIYDKKILRFYGYFRQQSLDSRTDYQIRSVNVMYFLEDDSITVMEPVVNVRLNFMLNLLLNYLLRFLLF